MYKYFMLKIKKPSKCNLLPVIEEILLKAKNMERAPIFGLKNMSIKENSRMGSLTDKGFSNSKTKYIKAPGQKAQKLKSPKCTKAKLQMKIKNFPPSLKVPKNQNITHDLFLFYFLSIILAPSLFIFCLDVLGSTHIY